MASPRESIIKKIQDYRFAKEGEEDGATLFIASSIFSRHIYEKIAVLHDSKTLDSLSGTGVLESEVECQDCVYIVQKLAEYSGKDYFHFFKRSSLDSIL